MQPKSLDDVLDLKTFVERYPHFSIEQLRWLIQQRKVNGMASMPGVVFKIGKRWYLDVNKFLQWTTSENNHSYCIKSNQHPVTDV